MDIVTDIPSDLERSIHSTSVYVMFKRDDHARTEGFANFIHECILKDAYFQVSKEICNSCGKPVERWCHQKMKIDRNVTSSIQRCGGQDKLLAFLCCKDKRCEKLRTAEFKRIRKDVKSQIVELGLSKGESSLLRCCNNCQKRSSKLEKCGGCGRAFYCSPACQTLEGAYGGV